MTVAAKQLKEAKIAIFANANTVDTQPGPAGEYENLRAALEAANHKVRSFTGESATAFAEALEGRQVLVIPELEKGGLGLSNALIDVLRGFVADGGTLVIGGDANDYGIGLLNGVFGLALSSNTTLSQLESLTRFAVAGTTFADDPAEILANDATTVLDDGHLPINALRLYQVGDVSAVAALPFGAGQIVYLGWDWNNGAPNGAQNNGWLKVLKSAISETDHKIVGTDAAETFREDYAPPGQAFTSALDDHVVAKGGFDSVSGWGGDDEIHGGGGADQLFGADGDDRIHGGGGDDYLSDQSEGGRLWGDGGNDRFAYGGLTVGDANRVMDFVSGEDVLYLDWNVFFPLGFDIGALPGSAFHRGSLASMDDSDRVIYTNSGKLYFDPDGSGILESHHFATLDDHAKLKASDVLLMSFG